MTDVQPTEENIEITAEPTATKVVAPSAHFSEMDNIQYDYEPQEELNNTSREEEDEAATTNNKMSSARRRRASSLRVSRRESINATPFDVSYHPGNLILYCRPRQRQRWGDSQVLPRVNWGDLFFDLFYVAAAYNTSNILVDSPSGRGLLYFLATFFAVMGLWMDKVFYDARFVVCGDDAFHRLFEVAVLVVLASAVLHIRTMDIMEQGADHNDTFVFCLVILIGNILTWLRYVEVYLVGIGQAVIKEESKRLWKMSLPHVGMILAATIVAGIEYYGNSSSYDSNSSSKGGEYGDYDAAVATGNYEGSSTTYEDDGGPHRYLADAESSSASYYATAKEHETSDLPMYLMLAGYIAKWLFFVVDIRFFFPGGGRHKEFVVPLNVDFVIHRNGEWNMLMLGESILSLLIVDVDEDDGYYATFYSALLTVILLQYLHFRSQPHHADGHALRRDKDAGIGWSCFHQIYSAALIAIGAAFTLMVLEFAYNTHDDNEEGGHRRFLAGGGGASALDPEDRKQRTAHMFCASLGIIWFCLDMMTIFHLGLKKSHNRCQCAATKRFNVKGIILVILRMGLLAFILTLSQYETDSENLAMLGLMGVVLQLVLRKLGTKYLSAEQVHDSGGGDEGDTEKDPEKMKWPNVTRAQAHPPDDGHS